MCGRLRKENGKMESFHFPFIAFVIVNQPPQARRPFSFSRWWYSLPEHRQDRFASLGPLLAVLLFVLAVLSAMAYLRMQEITAARRTLEHDGGYAHQHLSVRWRGSVRLWSVPRANWQSRAMQSNALAASPKKLEKTCRSYAI